MHSSSSKNLEVSACAFQALIPASDIFTFTFVSSSLLPLIWWMLPVAPQSQLPNEHSWPPFTKIPSKSFAGQLVYILLGMGDTTAEQLAQ